jgi:hypothetical protein
MIIMTWKVDSHIERGAEIFIQESSLKVLYGNQDSEKAGLIIWIFL